LNEKGTVMTRPSNSGMATLMATSIGASPASAAAHSAAGRVEAIAWMMGTSSAASCGAVHSSPSAPPIASTVVTTASTPCSERASRAGTAPCASGRSE
jgi:hypothetical protein